MAGLRTVVSDDVRVILCLTFNRHAPVAEVARFKSCLLECEHVLHAVELAGAYDLMVEARVASLAEYNERLEVLKAAVNHLIERYEANFVCRRFVRSHGPDQSIWVPCQHGKVRIDYKLIDKVVAEGDYMRVHCGEDRHLVHMTMHSMTDTLGEDFVLVHRSMLIRCDFIDRLLHRNFKWMARLKDGSHVTIAKSHVVDVLDRLHLNSAKVQSGSSNGEQIVEQSLKDSSKSAGDDEQREIVTSSPTIPGGERRGHHAVG